MQEKPKLDHALIEHNSMMKAALPALPICLAYFCLICNVLIPGLGTILSGLLCVCFGKPRFSQFDGAKPRLGSLLINIIVGVSQTFCVIFCLVGWGWSIWWGLILVQTASEIDLDVLREGFLFIFPFREIAANQKGGANNGRCECGKENRIWKEETQKA